MTMGNNFRVLYTLLVICQVLICNYFQFSPYAMISILPVMVLCIPLNVSTVRCMLMAFASALAVDWLAEGIIGLNAAAILPVAMLRKPVIRAYFGEDLITRKDSFTFSKYGFAKVSAAMITCILIFLLVYIILDGAGTKDLWFNLTRGFFSLTSSYLISLIAVRTLSPDDRK